jgi:hypothetical protein
MQRVDLGPVGNRMTVTTTRTAGYLISSTTVIIHAMTTGRCMGRMAVKVGRMTRRTFATIGYCAWLQAAIGDMTLLTGSTAACRGTVMDCRYDITCMTTNTVNSRAARICVHKYVTEARIRMI